MLEQAVIISLACFGVKYATSKGNILEYPAQSVWYVFHFFISFFLVLPYALMKFDTDNERSERYEKAGYIATDYAVKPFFGCVVCMASVHTLTYLFLTNSEILSINTIYLITSVGGLNWLLSSLLNLLTELKDYYQKLIKTGNV